MTQIFSKLATRLYESAVAWSLVFAFVRSAGNLLVLPVMLHKLNPEALGFWYVFLALAGISSLVDMGFFPTMTRVTAYLWAGAQELQKWGASMVEEDADFTSGPNYRLLADLVKTMRLYYIGLGILITLLMGVFGTMWIAQKASHLSDARIIVGSWLLFLPAVLINTMSGMWHPLLSGINRVRLAQQILVWSLVANYAVTFIGLILGAGLFAPVAGYLAMGLISRMAAQVKFNQFSRAKEHAHTARWSPNLLGTLWPTAWRTGMVTLGIYATLSLSTLICAAYLGARVTASFGLSMQLALAGISIATAFVAVKIPLIAQLHARDRLHEISLLVFPRLRWFWAVYVGLSLTAILFGERVLREILHSKTPLLPTPLLIGLFVVVGLEGHHGIFREITLTAHQNPFARPVVISGIIIAGLSVILVQWIGLWGLILAPGIVQICFNNWWTVVVGLRSFGSSGRDYLFGLLGVVRAGQSNPI